MAKGQWLLLVTCALSIFGTDQVWLVQLSSYQLWSYVGRNEFRANHLAWWHGIWGVILAPACLVTLGAVLMLWWRAPSVPPWMRWVGLSLQISLVLGTALWWGPLMANIEGPSGGLMPERYHLLLVTHWLRVLIVTAYSLLTLWMLVRSAWRG